MERNVPTGLDAVVAMPFFGDVRSAAVLSSLVLKRFREEARGSKYFILCSWPGYGHLFPFVDEYWEVKPEHAKRLWAGSDGMLNRTDLAVTLHRNLNHFFEDVADPADLLAYYSGGITQGFFDRFGHISCYKPHVPSAAVLGSGFSRELGRRQGNKVFVYPSLTADHWRHGRTHRLPVPVGFWAGLAGHLCDAGFTPVAWQTPNTHDLSAEMADRCMYVTDPDVGNVMSAMRAVGCVLDVFSGVSRLSTLARCPFLMVDERSRYAALKEYEFDDLVGEGVCRQYMFTFPTIIEGSGRAAWKYNFYDGIAAKLEAIAAASDRDAWPPTSERDAVVRYAAVRDVKSRRLGTRFIRVPRGDGGLPVNLTVE